jgi:hypothetical protein
MLYETVTKVDRYWDIEGHYYVREISARSGANARADE